METTAEQSPQTEIPIGLSPVAALRTRDDFLAADTPTRVDMFHAAIQEERKAQALRERYADLPEDAGEGQPSKVMFARMLFALPRPGGLKPGAQNVETSNPLTNVGVELPKAVGKGLVKGAQDVLGLPGLALQYLPGPTPGAERPTYPLAPAGEFLQKAAHLPEKLIAGNKEGFAPSPPGYDAVEHIARSAVGGALTGYAVGAVFPLLQAGMPLTDQVITAAMLGARGAAAGEAAKQVGLPPWTQAATELAAGGLTVQQIRALLTKLKDTPHILRYISKSAKQQPSYAANIAEGEQIQALTGAKLSEPELTRDPTAAAGYQYLKQQDPTFNKLATTAEQQKLEAMGTATSRALRGGQPEDAVPELLSGQGGASTSPEDILHGVIETAKAPVRTAQAESVAAQATLENAAAARRSVEAQTLLHQSEGFKTRVLAEDKMLGELDAIQQRQYALKDVNTNLNQQAAQELRDLRVRKTQILNNAQDTMLNDLNTLGKRQATARLAAAKGNADAAEELYNLRIEHQDILQSYKERLKVQLDDLQKRRYDFEDAARLGDQNAAKRLQEIDVERTNLLKDADDVFQGVVTQKRGYNKLLTTTERNVQDELVRTTALNQQDMERVQGYAGFDAMKIAPTAPLPGTATALAKLQARKQQLTAAVAKGDTAAQNELNTVIAQEQQLKTSSKPPERNLAAVPLGQRAQTGFEAITEQGETAANLQRTIAARTDMVAKKLYGDFYKQFNELETGAKPYLDALDALEQRVTGWTKESYIPDPLINDIRQDIILKAKTAEYNAIRAGTLHNPDGTLVQLPHDVQGNPQPLEAFLAERASVNDQILNDLKLTIEDVHGFRSRALTERRNIPPDSPRRSVVQAVYGVTDAAMEDVARQAPEAHRALRGGIDPDTGKKVLGIDPWYAREIQRETADPGHFILQRNPATGQPLHPPDVIADFVFSQGPTVGQPSIAKSTNLQNFTTHMKNIDEAIAEGYIRQDYDLVAQARQAKNAVLDTARTKFYLAVHDPTTGTYLPEKAQQWLQDYGTVIKSNPDLFAIFKNQQTRLDAIREVQATTQGRIADLQEYQTQLARARQLASQEGGEAIFTARGARSQARQEATAGAQAQRGVLTVDEAARQEQEIQQGRQLTAETTDVRRAQGEAARTENRRFTDEQHRLVEEKIARGDTLDAVEQSIAGEARTVRGTMRSTRRDVAQTDIAERQRLADEQVAQGAITTSEERQLAAEAQASRGGMRETRRTLEEIRLADRQKSAAAVEQERLAQEGRKAADAAYDSAIEEYRTTFQGRQAALESLKEDAATQALGARARDVITEIEAMPSGTARNRAYMKMMQDAHNDPAVRDTLLKYMWEESLQKTGTKATNLEREVLLPNPKTAAQFLADKERVALFSKIAPEYLADLKTIQAGFERVAALESASVAEAPARLKYTPRTLRYAIDAGVGATMELAGQAIGMRIPYGVGIATGIGITEAVVRLHDARKIAMLRNLYLNPEKTRLGALIFNENTNPAMRKAFLAELMAHTPSAVAAAQEKE